MRGYDRFIESKGRLVHASGIDDPPELNPRLFGFQRDITRWAIRCGRAAIWADCGMGKTWMALEWARVIADHTQRPVLILTPLAVAEQFVTEAGKLGVGGVRHIREAFDGPGIHVCNYERLHKLDLSQYAGVVLDESSVLKDYSGKTRNALIDGFAETQYRLCCTATPAPNDFMELGNHAEFLGTMTRSEMLAMFFVHDGGETQKWRLKGHAEGDFWRWVSSWAVAISKPSDLGYSDDGYDLPELVTIEHVVETDSSEIARDQGMLFAPDARTLADQRAARRVSLAARVAMCAEMANSTDEPWLVWCDLNAEGDALEKSIDGAVQVSGSDSTDEKESRIRAFCDGSARVLVTKPTIAGHGLNLQHCARVAFVGVSHSFEQWYQAIRRCWRFGQARPVECHVIVSDREGAIVDNLKRKQSDAHRLVAGMVEHMADLSREELRATCRTETKYNPTIRMEVPRWIQSEC